MGCCAWLEPSSGTPTKWSSRNNRGRLRGMASRPHRGAPPAPPRLHRTEKMDSQEDFAEDLKLVLLMLVLALVLVLEQTTEQRS